MLLAFRKCGRQNKKVFYVRGHFDKIWLIYGAAGFDSLDIGTWKFKTMALTELKNKLHINKKVDTRTNRQCHENRYVKRTSHL